MIGFKLPAVRLSLQLRMGLGYTAIIALLLVLLNTYPIITVQDLMFRAQQTELQAQAVILTNSLNTADRLTEEGIEQSLLTFEELDVTRVLITDEAGLSLYDSVSEPGLYVLDQEVVQALCGRDAFFSRYADGVFHGRAAAPILNRGTVVGAVCLYSDNTEQGAFLTALARNLRVISAVVCLAVFALFLLFSHSLTGRVARLLAGIRTVRSGEYAHRVPVAGRDELSDLAEEFNLLTSRLQATEAERRRFVSDASHELKTPLASIRLLTDSILQDENIDPATTREFVTDIGEAADRLIHLSEELLVLNRMDEGRLHQPEPLNVREEALQVFRMLTPQAEISGVSLIPELAGDCIVECSRADLRQILINLTENAIKYNVRGGSVTVRAELLDTQVRIEVEDTGVGIPEDALALVFERFYRVDKARSRAAGGTGLGLAIVRDTVRLYGGEITVRRCEPSGVCFTVLLPARKEAEV